MKSLILTALTMLVLVSCKKDVIEPQVEPVVLGYDILIQQHWDRSFQETVTNGLVTYTEVDLDSGVMIFDPPLIKWGSNGDTAVLSSYSWSSDTSFVLGTGQVYYIDLLNDSELIMHFESNDTVKHRLYYDSKL